MTHKIRGVREEEYAILCQQTSPKCWVGDVNMTSNRDIPNSAHQIQMTTIFHWMKSPHENFLRTLLIGAHARDFRSFYKIKQVNPKNKHNISNKT